jgi:hypothetical protein
VQKLEAQLPPRLRAKVSHLPTKVESVVHAAALEVVSSEQFANVWDEANRRVQPQVVAAFTGKTKRGASVHDDGTVTLDLSGVAQRLRARLTSLGVDVNAKVPAGRFNTDVELFKWPWLGWVQDAINLLQQLAWLLPVLTLLCFGGAVALSTDRRRTVLRSGLGVAAGMLLILVAIAVGRGPYLDLFSQPEGRLAGGAAYDQLLHSLRGEVRALLMLSVVVALGAWLSDPKRHAVTGRDEPATGGSDVATSSASRGSRTEVRVIVIALGFVALAAVDQLTVTAVLVIALVVVAVLVLLEVIGRRRHEVSSEHSRT